MIGIWLICLVFAVTVPWGGWFIRILIARGIGKRIREDEPDSHMKKWGTATMGGLYFMVPIVVFSIVLVAMGHWVAVLPMVAMVVFGLLGAYDDVQGLRDSTGVGWLVGVKFLWQWVAAALISLIVYLVVPALDVTVPWGTSWRLGFWAVPLLALSLVTLSNAVNLTDGLDGLAGGTSAIAFLAYALLAQWDGQESLMLSCFVTVGALLAFLWYNVNPARVFMGDVGSQALGAGLAVVIALSGHWLVAVPICAILLAEALSVMTQVSYFKYTRIRQGEGKRIFRMSPLHYHFELGGWSEVQVTQRFWIIACVLAALGVALGVRGW